MKTKVTIKHENPLSTPPEGGQYYMHEDGNLYILAEHDAMFRLVSLADGFALCADSNTKMGAFGGCYDEFFLIHAVTITTQR